MSFFLHGTNHYEDFRTINFPFFGGNSQLFKKNRHLTRLRFWSFGHARSFSSFFNSQWTPSGDAFIIGSDLERLESETLPQYFRHNRFQSLVRQVRSKHFYKPLHILFIWHAHILVFFVAKLLFFSKNQSRTQCLDLQTQVVSP